MAVLQQLAALVSADHVRDDGVPTASIALLDHLDAEVETHVITSGNEKPDTMYQAASISKAVTGVAVARLIDQKRLTLDTKVVDHVPKTVWSTILDTKTAHLMELVTVGMLLSHRSGLSQGGFPGYGEHGDRLPTTAEILAGTAPANTPRVKFLSFPGSQSSYSGGGYVLLQALLEHVYGKPFELIMAELVLQPLKMDRSCFGDQPAGADDYARAHISAEVLGTIDRRGYARYPELAAAGLWSTPTDLLKVVVAIQKSLHSDDGFLRRETAKMLLRLVSPKDPDLFTTMGWSADATFFAFSGGNKPGYICYVIGVHGLQDFNTGSSSTSAAMADGKMSLCVMTNSMLGEMTMRKLVGAVFALKNMPLYPSLPSTYGSMRDYVPYPSRWELLAAGEQDSWRHFVGEWRPRRQHSAVEWEEPDKCYIVTEIDRKPMLQLMGAGKAMQLLPALIPWQQIDGGTLQPCLMVDGLDVALSMVKNHEKDHVVELIQQRTTTLLRNDWEGVGPLPATR